MEDNLIGFILIVLGVVAIIGNLHDKRRFVQLWFVVLTTVFTGYYAYNELADFDTGEQNLNPLYLGIAILFLALVVTRFVGEGKRAYVGIIAVLFPLLFLILGDTIYTFADAGFTGADLVKVGVIGAIVPLAFLLVSWLFTKFGLSFQHETRFEKYGVESAFMFFFLFGVSIAGYFLAGAFGVFVALISFLSSSLLLANLVEFGRNAAVPFTLAMILLLPLSALSAAGEADNMSMLQGKVFAGLFLGAMVTVAHAAVLSWLTSLTGWLKRLLLMKALIIPSVLVAIAGGLYFAYESFGGTESIVAMLVGSALTLPMTHGIFPNRNYASTTLLIGTAILLVPYLKHDTQELSTEIEGLNETTQRIVVVADDGSQKELDILDLNEAKGSWVANLENSNLNFTLEASGSKTKGKFKSYEADFTVPDTWQSARMKVTIPVKSISTFNAIRDESLLSDAAFFEEAKYPTMSFSFQGVELTEKGYLAQGDFTMKNTTKKVPIAFQFVGKGERNGKEFIVLKGSGTLDRTEFGMTPDPGIGNQVNFEFQTEFIQK